MAGGPCRGRFSEADGGLGRLSTPTTYDPHRFGTLLRVRLLPSSYHPFPRGKAGTDWSCHQDTTWTLKAKPRVQVPLLNLEEADTVFRRTYVGTFRKGGERLLALEGRCLALNGTGFIRRLKVRHKFKWKGAGSYGRRSRRSSMTGRKSRGGK